MTSSNVIIIRHRLLKMLGLLVPGVLGVIVLLGLLGMSWFWSPEWLIVAVTGAVVLSYFLASAMAIEIGQDGFVIRTLSGGRSRRWSDIEGDFAVIEIGSAYSDIGLNKAVAYKLSADYKARVGSKPTSLLSGNFGYDDVLMDVYQLAVEEIAALLNERKRQNSSVLSS